MGNIELSVEIILYIFHVNPNANILNKAQILHLVGTFIYTYSIN